MGGEGGGHAQGPDVHVRGIYVVTVFLFEAAGGVQDPVPSVGKFWVIYSRPGQRVLVDQQGDLQVRPTPLDQKLLSLNPGGPQGTPCAVSKAACKN